MDWIFGSTQTHVEILTPQCDGIIKRWIFGKLSDLDEVMSPYKKRPESLFSFFPSYEDTTRRQPSAIQKESSRQEPNQLMLLSWTFQTLKL